jgi:hypothetical protein
MLDIWVDNFPFRPGCSANYVFVIILVNFKICTPQVGIGKVRSVQIDPSQVGVDPGGAIETCSGVRPSKWTMILPRD